jgi:hypothetical protein
MLMTPSPVKLNSPEKIKKKVSFKISKKSIKKLKRNLFTEIFCDRKVLYKKIIN